MKATITDEGSVRLPEAARTELEMEPGTPVRVDLQGDHVVIRRARMTVAGQRARRARASTRRALERREAYAALMLWRRVQP